MSFEILCHSGLVWFGVGFSPFRPVESTEIYKWMDGGMGGYLRLTVCLEHLTVLINKFKHDTGC